MKQRRRKKKIKLNEDNLRDLWDNVKHPNVWIIGVPEEEDKKKGHETILEEIIVEVKWSHSVMSDSVRPHRQQPTRLLCPWDFPGKSAWVGCHCLLWIIVENFLKMGKEIATQGQEIQRVLKRINLRQNTSRHILIKLMKILLLGRKVITNLDGILKSRHITLPTKVRLVKAMVFQ